MGKRLSPLSYPVEVEIHLAQRKKYTKKYNLLDKKEIAKEIIENTKREIEYGVLLRITDHGIGMTAEDISAISNVGSTHEKREKEIEQMPPWLSPTAEFGIGLQAAFLVSDFLTAYTYPRTNEK